jgi:DNA polymerase-3 subunit epsilon
MQHTSERKYAIEKANDILGKNPIYMDTETTGLHSTAEIVEIAIIDQDGNTIFESLVRPSQPIPPDATRIHRITDEMVRSAPYWPIIWPTIRSILSNHHTAIYNAEYDLRMLQSSLKRYNQPWMNIFDTSCIMNLFARFRGDWNPKYRAFRFYSLDDAGKICKIPLKNTHLAKDDSLLARELLHYIANASP